MNQVFKARVRLGDGRAGRVAALSLVAICAAAIAPAAASAAPPRIAKGPKVAGTPQVGQTLRADDYEYSGGSATWSWWRCDGPRPTSDDCDQISGANQTTYKATDSDRGRFLRVVLS